ncbi:MAG TPA: class I SAM-dependent methyltransferase [Haliangiales bacterium]|nr:class I SAM-dependent methyltransferase [Haliangiales bacterium]
MATDDRGRWNERWRARDHTVADEPSTWLVSLAPHLPARGRALDVAGGAGRHAVWLARRGLDVTLVDVSDEALALADRAAAAAGVPLALVRGDLDADPDALPAGPWDVIVCFHYLDRPLLPRLAAALAPGGVLVFCQPTRRNLERHPRPGPAHLLDEGEAAAFARGLEIVVSEEGWLDEGRHEARLVARRARRP